MSSAALLNQVVHVAALTLEQINAVLAEFDLTESLARVLWALGLEAAPATMRELARELRCDPSNVTLMSAKLEQAGLVERRPHPTDGRVRILALTEQGKGVWARLVERLEATSPVLGLTRAEQKQLSGLLAKVQAASSQSAPARVAVRSTGGDRRRPAVSTRVARATRPITPRPPRSAPAIRTRKS
ncbi:MAG: MarR family transcriptional regulator [Chloroflexota bacterium]|nr:MarR family transcriptional regulator [Chloroflexota bacterium]